MNLTLPWGDRRPRFVYPISVTARTAVFEPLFRRNANLLYLDSGAPNAAEQIRNYRPATLAGRFEQLMAVASQTKPTHALVVFTEQGERCLSEADRDALWDIYGLPVFEQVITPSGRLVAWECEAHDGLHLAEGARVHNASETETSLCHCGASSARSMKNSIAPAFSGERESPMRPLPAQLRSATRPLPT